MCTVYQQSNHCHDANQEQDFKQFNLELNLKHRCQSDPNLSLRQIFEEECGSASDAEYKRLKSSMVHHRKKFLPKNPTSAQETEEYLQNEVVSSLLTFNANWVTCELVKRDEYSYLLFASKKVLERLPEERLFNINCTMRVVPAGYFKILMTMSVVVKNVVSKWKSTMNSVDLWSSACHQSDKS